MKPKSAFLTAAGGDSAAAFDALYAAYAATQQALSDAESNNTEVNDGNTIRTRVIAKALIPLAEKLGIELPEPGKKPAANAEQQIAAQVAEKLEGLEAIEEARDFAVGLLGEAGLDLEALQGDKAEEAVDAWLGGIDTALNTAETASSQLAAYQYAADNGLDPKALLLTKGAEQLRQVEREREENGQKVKEMVWVVGEGDEAPLAADHFKPVLGALQREPQTQKQAGTAWVSGQESKAQTGGSPYEQYQREQKQAQKPSGYVDPLQPAARAGNTNTPATTQGA